MKIPIFKKPTIDLAEIHQYISDLDRITLLRDKTTEPAERDRYTQIIEIMQKVMMYLNRLRDTEPRPK